MKTWFILGCFVVAICVSVARAQEPADTAPAPAQESSLTGGPATWIVKLTTAMQDSSEAILTSDEAQELVRAYSAMEQRQAADIAVSDTHVYVLGPSGVVLMSQELQ